MIALVPVLVGLGIGAPVGLQPIIDARLAASLGSPVRAIDPLRALGIGLVFAGVVVFRLATPGT